ncbi:unnamed protein product [Caenorhabditis bovis]|uniref:PNPLA domain-containing protein n=1 Tax=Caenorhabditis bovis TaxID=2654633 RepID=A0A8S1FC91_9PELO|nr:unnamed protein product [Caenorhabditis bovis]
MIQAEPVKRVGLDDLHKKPTDLKTAIENSDGEGFIGAFIQNQSFSTTDAEGNTLLHFAAKRGNRLMVRAICSFSNHLELWKRKNSEGKLPKDVTDDPSIRRDLMSLESARPLAQNHHTKFNKQLVEKRIKEPRNENLKVLLSMDGGGLRAIIQSMFLVEMEKELGRPIYEHVHWIGGTSCGGINAATLACGIGLIDAQKIFLTSRRRIFCGNTSMFPKHDPRGIEKILKDLFGTKTPISNITAHKIMVTTAKVQSAPPLLYLFRSYAPRITNKEFEQLGYLDPSKILLWKAIRCTSAAPLYFSSFNGMADGAIFCNNPCIALMTEFFKLKKIENHRGIKNNDEIGCVISIGTGIEPVVPLNGIDINVNNAFSFGGNFREIMASGKNLITMFLYQCTTSHNVNVGQSREWAHSINVPFFRFSPKLSKCFELDNVNPEIMFNSMFETLIYVNQIKPEIVDLCRLLKALPKNEQSCDYLKITKNE